MAGGVLREVLPSWGLAFPGGPGLSDDGSFGGGGCGGDGAGVREERRRWGVLFGADGIAFDVAGALPFDEHRGVVAEVNAHRGVELAGGFDAGTRNQTECGGAVHLRVLTVELFASRRLECGHLRGDV